MSELECEQNGLNCFSTHVKSLEVGSYTNCTRYHPFAPLYQPSSSLHAFAFGSWRPTSFFLNCTHSLN
jgi:hypothetical protein